MYSCLGLSDKPKKPSMLLSVIMKEEIFESVASCENKENDKISPEEGTYTRHWLLSSQDYDS